MTANASRDPDLRGLELPFRTIWASWMLGAMVALIVATLLALTIVGVAAWMPTFTQRRSTFHS